MKAVDQCFFPMFSVTYNKSNHAFSQTKGVSELLLPPCRRFNSCKILNRWSHLNGTQYQKNLHANSLTVRNHFHCSSILVILLTSSLDFYSFYHFEGFRVPLEQCFLSSIPDLLEIPHVQLDYTSQIIYYTIVLQGMVSNPGEIGGRGHYVQYLYQKCVSLSEKWLQNVKETPADFFAALTLVRFQRSARKEIS